jgi:hypothetical protein
MPHEVHLFARRVTMVHVVVPELPRGVDVHRGQEQDATDDRVQPLVVEQGFVRRVVAKDEHGRRGEPGHEPERDHRPPRVDVDEGEHHDRVHRDVAAGEPQTASSRSLVARGRDRFDDLAQRGRSARWTLTRRGGTLENSAICRNDHAESLLALSRQHVMGARENRR